MTGRSPEKAELPRETYQTTTIVNTDDAVFGAGAIVADDG